MLYRSCYVGNPKDYSEIWSANDSVKHWSDSCITWRKSNSNYEWITAEAHGKFKPLQTSNHFQGKPFTRVTNVVDGRPSSIHGQYKRLCQHPEPRTPLSASCEPSGSAAGREALSKHTGSDKKCTPLWEWRWRSFKQCKYESQSSASSIPWWHDTTWLQFE